MQPCKFFAAGRCYKGVTCRYKHESDASHHALATRGSGLDVQETEGFRKLDKDAMSADREASAIFREVQREYDYVDDPGNSFYREIGGTFVRLEDGRGISKVSFASDYSATWITGLPNCSTPYLVSQILKGVGFDVAPQHVRIICQQSGRKSAEVEIEDPRFATKLRRKIESVNKLDQQLEVAEFSLLKPRGLGGYKIGCKRVDISWPKPARYVSLSYEMESSARRVSAKLNNGSYRILGQSVRFERLLFDQHPLDPSGPQSSQCPKPAPWRIVLSNVPLGATERAIEKAIRHDNDRPYRVDLGAPIDYEDSEAIMNQVSSALASFDEVEWFAQDCSGTCVKAAACFQTEKRAKKAAEDLDKLQILKGLRNLSIKRANSAVFHMHKGVYRALKSQIEQERFRWEEDHVSFEVYHAGDSFQQSTILKIDGRNTSTVQSVKLALERILAGNTIMKGARPLWNESFESNGTNYQQLKAIQRVLGVLIVRDQNHKLLKYFGPPKRMSQAVRRIQATLESEKAFARSIDLDEEQFDWAYDGGFSLIASTLGQNIVFFDKISEPPKIVIINATEDQMAIALEIVEEKREHEQIKGTAGKVECVVCRETAENPILTRCHHLYCLDCFYNLFGAAASIGEEINPVCQGNHSNYPMPLALKDLRHCVSTIAFEQTLQSLFESYIRHRPETYRFCPTPDCGTVYRKTDAPSLYTCKECGVSVCTACHFFHEDRACS